MGLFDGKAKKEAIESEILQAFSKLDILDNLVNTIVENEQGWVTECQSYYDDRIRTIRVEEDLFQIKWSQYETVVDKKQLKCQYEETIVDVVNYSYTRSGYTPLYAHTNEKGKVDVSLGRVIYLWASIVRERMQAKLPQCSFGELIENETYTTFRYKVPNLEWKGWF